jgi:hypothetical protein
MAETKKAQPRKARPKARTAAKPRKRSTSRPQATKPRQRSTSKPKTSANEPASRPQAAREAVEATAKDAGGAVKDAGGAVGRAASKAKVPLVAGGAALAGAAGGLALGARRTHHRKNGLAGVSSKDLAKAARKAGDVGAQVGEIALEVRRARETSNGRAHRSPIEVVLQGLTSRGSHD